MFQTTEKNVRKPRQKVNSSLQIIYDSNRNDDWGAFLYIEKGPHPESCDSIRAADYAATLCATSTRELCPFFVVDSKINKI